MTTPKVWHALPVENVLSELEVLAASGLSEDYVRSRRATYGPNALTGKPPRPLWRQWLDQFSNFLVIVLLAAALLAGLVGDLLDAAVIVLVILFNGALGFFQERRAEATLAALKDMLAPSARVRRDGEQQEIHAIELVPGDILLLEAGDRIPADARVMLAHSAEVAEAALTGESQPVSKLPAMVAAEAGIAERSNMVFMNTVVTRGRIEAAVTATGMQSEMGRLAKMLEEAGESSTPLQIQLDRLGKKLAAIAGGVVTLIFVIGVLRGDDLVRTAMTAIALAVAAIPEGLPAVVTVTLALGMHRMAKRQAIVKQLAAVETLGCTTVICTDKTGTLTLSQMTARGMYFDGRHFAVTGQGYSGAGEVRTDDARPLPAWHELALPAVLCADAQLDHGRLIGDPTEGALLALAAKLGMEASEARKEFPRLAEIPFDSSHKFMATFHHQDGEIQMWVKGAPDVLLGRAKHHRVGGVEVALDAEARQGFAAENQAMAESALRVLALAGRSIPAEQFDLEGELMRWADDLTLVGLVGMADPPRPEVRAAIAECRGAGIAVKMITGDHRATAAAIARDLGLTGEVCEGCILEGMSDADLAELIRRTDVFARVAPAHKMRIVQVLQAEGHVVAMTGDGVNDAPALKTADIGVAMGITGTEVTKEAANLILTDDNFASIVGAVHEGRTIYDNIVKFVRFQLSTNIGAMLTVIGAPLVGLPTPFTAIQILWVNIIMDGPPAMTLGVEPGRPGIMRAPPRRASDEILSGPRLLRLTLYGITMAVGTLAAYAWGSTHGGEVYARTLAFTTFVLFQFFNIFNARAEHGTAFNRHFFRNGKLWLALFGVLALQLVAVHWGPAQAVFDTEALSLNDWLWSIAIASSTLLLEEARKLLLRCLPARFKAYARARVRKMFRKG